MENHFKENLNRIIKERDIPIKCIAADLDVSLKSVYGWVGDYAGYPKYDTLIKLADYLEVTVDELIR